jgi:hypothetical protein
MTEWDPRQELGPYNYLKFKLGLWVEISSLPRWVSNAHDGYYEGFIDKYGHRPYDIEKVYTGENLEYKIYYEPVKQGVVEKKYYTRVKRPYIR